MAGIEDTGALAHGVMLFDDALILHRHLPPAEFDHARAQLAVHRVQRSFLHRAFGHETLLLRLGRRRGRPPGQSDKKRQKEAWWLPLSLSPARLTRSGRACRFGVPSRGTLQRMAGTRGLVYLRVSEDARGILGPARIVSLPLRRPSHGQTPTRISPTLQAHYSTAPPYVSILPVREQPPPHRHDRSYLPMP